MRAQHLQHEPRSSSLAPEYIPTKISNRKRPILPPLKKKKKPKNAEGRGCDWQINTSTASKRHMPDKHAQGAWQKQNQVLCLSCSILKKNHHCLEPQNANVAHRVLNTKGKTTAHCRNISSPSVRGEAISVLPRADKNMQSQTAKAEEFIYIMPHIPHPPHTFSDRSRERTQTHPQTMTLSSWGS